MKIIYLSAKDFPGTTANHVHIRELSRVMARQSDYSVVIGGGSDVDAVAREFPDANVINRRLTKSRGRTLDYFFWFPKFIRDGGFDGETVFLSNDAQLLLVALFWRFILRKKYKVVSYWHMFFKDWQNGPIARGSDAALVLTSHLEQRLLERYPNLRGKILVSPDAVNKEIFDISLSKDEARRKVGLADLPADTRMLLYTGRFKTLGMDKGIADILKALAIGLAEHPTEYERVIFVAVGGRPEDVAEYQALAARLGVADHVRLIGFVAQHELAAYQKAADILMLYFPRNEHYSYYMSPMKLFEYMVADRPIIASDLPAIREILSEREAFIVPPGDPSALAKTIGRALSAPAEAEKLAKAAYALGREYTWEEKGRKIISFLERSLSAISLKK